MNILEQLKCSLETNNWNLETYKKKIEMRRKKVLEEITVDKWCFLVKTLAMLLLNHYRTQNANNACMSYKNEVKMYSSSQAQGNRLDSPNISMGLSVWPNFIFPQGNIYIKEDYSWLAKELHFKHLLGHGEPHWPLFTIINFNLVL